MKKWDKRRDTLPFVGLHFFNNQEALGQLKIVFDEKEEAVYLFSVDACGSDGLSRNRYFSGLTGSLKIFLKQEIFRDFLLKKVREPLVRSFLHRIWNCL